MAIRNRTVNNTGYGLDNALQALAPQPINANRAPTSSDTSPIGTIWAYPSAQQLWINDGIVNSASQWLQLTTSGGPGSFCDLTVTGTCGATNIQGGAFGVTIDSTTGTDIDIGTTNNAAIGIGNAAGTTQDISILGGSGTGALLLGTNGGKIAVNSLGGTQTFTTTNGAFTVASGTGEIDISADAAATTVKVGTGAGVKGVTIGSTNTTSATTIQSGATGSVTVNSHGGSLDIISGTGALGISDDAAATTVNIATGGAAKTLSLGSSTTSSTTNIIAGTGGILLGAAGLVQVNPTTPTAASPTASVTSNVRVIVATFTGFTTAANGTQAYTIVSSDILATSGIFVTVTCPTTGAALTVTGVQQLVGSIVVNTTNNGGSAVADNVIVSAWIIS